MMKIGYIGNNYPEKRNIIGRSKSVQYLNVSWTNFFAYLNRVNFIWKKWFNVKFFKAEYYRYCNWLPVKVDGIHFFNSISIGNVRHIITFETLLPYFWVVKNDYKDQGNLQSVMQDTNVTKALHSLVSPHCMLIIAMSENTRMNQLQFMDLYPHWRPVLEKKMRVLHPPQEVFGMSESKKSNPACFELIFVGRAFYRKGGKELVAALEEVRKKHNIKLYLISSLDPEAGWFNVQEDGIGDDLEWIAQKSWIEHHRNIPNHEVIRWMQRCHLGFLPTWQDTYGYSVLEMQACGCPVVTTDIRSLPEINSNEVGWLIPVPKNQWSEWDYQVLDGEENASLWLIQQLVKVIDEALSNPLRLSEKGKASIERIQRDHDPKKHGEKLFDFYQQSFGQS